MSARNRRVFFRLPIELSVRFRARCSSGTSPWWEGQVEDLSAGGMRMRAVQLDEIDETELFEDASDLEIEFDVAGTTPLAGVQLPAKVVWLERGEDGARRAGIQFVEIATNQQEALERFVVDSCRVG